MFQKSIIEKYLAKLDANLLREKYELFCTNYKNETKIENIRALKEEQYQEGFIRDVFCSVLNYTIKPEPTYNILTELKNDIPLKLKHETLSEEKQITDNFYSDYSTFKRSLFEDMIENNPATDKLVLFKKTQKFLDRILFVHLIIWAFPPKMRSGFLPNRYKTVANIPLTWTRIEATREQIIFPNGKIF